MILLVMLCQTLVYKEVTALFQLSNRKLVHSRFILNIAVEWIYCSHFAKMARST
jgi:hypothetical protein